MFSDGEELRQRVAACSIIGASRARARPTHPLLALRVSEGGGDRSRQRLRRAEVGKQIADLLISPGLELPFRHQRLAAGTEVVDLVAGQRDVLPVGSADYDHVGVLISDETRQRAAVERADDVVLEPLAN